MAGASVAWDTEAGAAEKAAPRERARAILLTLGVTLAAVLIAVVAYRFGDQPIRYDALGYFEVGRALYLNGPLTFADNVRTYGFPMLLAALIALVGQDQARVNLALLVVQVAAYLGAAYLASWRIGRIFGSDALRIWVYAFLALNVWVLALASVVLTEALSTTFVLLATAFAIPVPGESARARYAALVASGLAAACSMMVRPSNSTVLLGICLLWVASLWLSRRSVAGFVTGLAVLVLAILPPLTPQVAFNFWSRGVLTPLVADSLLTMRFDDGARWLKYGTVALDIDAVPPVAGYMNPFSQGYPSFETFVRADPFGYVLTMLLHQFSLIDQTMLFPYIRDVTPWYRWPLAILGYLVVYAAAVGLVLAWCEGQRGFVARLLWVVGAYAAIYLPFHVEERYGVTVMTLLLIPAALAASRARRLLVVPKIDVLVLVPMCAFVLAASGLSYWLQQQAPLLAQVEELLQRQAAGLDTKPEARIEVHPPLEWLAGGTVQYPIEVRNTTKQPWNAERLHPVVIRVLYSDRLRTDRESTVAEVPLPNDVAPGQSVRTTIRLQAPGEPGVYALRHDVTRVGVYGQSEASEHEIAVVPALTGDATQSAAVAPQADRPVGRVEVSPPTQWAVGGRQTYEVTVTNDGAQIWRVDRGFPVVLAVTFGRRGASSEQAPDSPPQQFPLPHDLRPGESVRLSVTVEPPAQSGQYDLRHWAWRTNVAWSRPLATTRVEVAPAR